MPQAISTKLAIAAGVLALGGIAIYFSIQNDQLKAASAAESMPVLPVTVSFHHALLGHSMVADFHSNALTDMGVVVDVMDAATRGHRRFEVGVGPGRGGTHIGPLERVMFEPGDVLTLTHDGYQPVSAQVP